MRFLFIAKYILSIFGLVSIIIAFLTLHNPQFHSYWIDVLILAVSFTTVAKWSVILPSGCNLRPGMAIAIASMFILPPQLTPLVVLLGLIMITALGKKPFPAYPLTIGHVSASLYIGGYFFRYFVRSETISLPIMLPYAVVALFLHLTVNRIIASIIITKNNSPFKEQLVKEFHEINWGHFNTHLIGLITAILYEAKGPWSLLLSLPLLVGIFKSVSYYSINYQLQKTVSIDALTQVENRAALETFTSSMGKHPTHGTVVMLDLDKFKKVNDEMGHAFGDTLLRQVALVLKQNMRDLDRVFRFGGDEFVFFLPHEPADIEAIQNRIDYLKKSVNDECCRLGVSTQASVGSANIPNDTSDFKTLITIADERMYIAKSRRSV